MSDAFQLAAWVVVILGSMKWADRLVACSEMLERSSLFGTACVHDGRLVGCYGRLCGPWYIAKTPCRRYPDGGPGCTAEWRRFWTAAAAERWLVGADGPGGS